jgi:hypothetical protein
MRRIHQPGQITNNQTKGGIPRRTRRSRTNLRAPLRASEAGIMSPEIKKNKPVLEQRRRNDERAQDDVDAVR